MATIRAGFQIMKRMDRQSSALEMLQLDLPDLFQKANASEDLAEGFHFLSSVYAALYIARRKKAGKSKRAREVYEWGGKAMKLLGRIKKAAGGKEWQVLLHEYAVAHPDRVGDIMTPVKQEAYVELLQDFLDVSNDATGSEASATLLAFNMLKYLGSHQMDPFSCLVGLRANADVRKQVEERHLDVKELNEQSEDAISFTKVQLANHILNWAFVSDAEELQLKVRRLAGELRGVKDLNLGDLVLVKTQTKVQFARYSGRQGDQISLHTNVQGASLKTTIDSVFPLPDKMRTRIKEDSLMELEKLVQLPTDEFFHEVMKLVEKCVREFLVSNQLDLTAIQRANDNECSIAELSDLKKAQAFLKECVATPPEELISSVQSLIDLKAAAFNKNISVDEFFQPTYEKRMSQLKDLQTSAIIRMNIHRLLGMCDAGLDQLKLQKRELMNGVRKDTIVSWWLDEIDKAVLEFINRLGYEYDAIPENYVENPPNDFKAVAKNIRLLKEVLDTKKDQHGTVAMMEELKKRIYPRIDAFVEDARIVLSDHFSIDRTQINVLEALTKAFEEQKGAIDEQVEEWIDSMLKDMAYLEEMKKMEDPVYAAECGHFHIVPISGLIISVFCRLENECTTALELWEPVNYVNEVKRTETCALHLAVTGEDMEQTSLLCVAEPDTVNVQDKNGWTPLHCAASNRGRMALEMCKKLLAVPGAEVNIQNNDGNTALHYLVRNQVDEKDTDLLIEILRDMMGKGLDASAANKFGETPLHHSCFRNGTAIVSALLDNDADVNALNTIGESPLFYAVRRGNTVVGELLVKRNADLSFVNKDGDTALDLARKCARDQLVEVLGGKNEGWTKSKSRRPSLDSPDRSMGLHLRFKANSRSQLEPVAAETRYAVQEVREQWSKMNSGDFSKVLCPTNRAEGSQKISPRPSEPAPQKKLSPGAWSGSNATVHNRKTGIALGSSRQAE